MGLCIFPQSPPFPTVLTFCLHVGLLFIIEAPLLLSLQKNERNSKIVLVPTSLSKVEKQRIMMIK